MRYAVLADIHANLTALQAVLTDIERRGGVEGLWCLGDIVGYGPDPHECIELIRHKASLCVAGNHDRAAEGKVNPADFNVDAGAAALWTRRQLQPQEVEYLESLPLILEKDNVTLAHGSPRNPIWEYILSTDTAEANFQVFPTACCLVGHSHLPLCFEKENDPSLPESGNKKGTVKRDLIDGCLVELGGKRAIINPGSVGQPRDNDPRASYGIYDAESASFTLHRVPYDIGAVQQRMEEAGLPGPLIERLAYGR
jgi:diadenosine tetraphosphatase ApaH/serine/threonine PP2A family protein phosphatase